MIQIISGRVDLVYIMMVLALPMVSGPLTVESPPKIRMQY